MVGFLQHPACVGRYILSRCLMSVYLILKMSPACMLGPCGPKRASFCKNLLLCHFPALACNATCKKQQSWQLLGNRGEYERFSLRQDCKRTGSKYQWAHFFTKRMGCSLKATEGWVRKRREIAKKGSLSPWGEFPGGKHVHFVAQPSISHVTDHAVLSCPELQMELCGDLFAFIQDRALTVVSLPNSIWTHKRPKDAWQTGSWASKCKARILYNMTP